ncbi:SRPBCC family protein [Microlunatus sp. Gsoil 973]|uniref:SRPBCC family protein n=1 Tax=Microlunatus sp. Gsoil 973 TaxID=2672569 RepID=UPI0012B449A9|nr:SRPBCC family protein [Microlunatus sp. Gsoil 973]QGN34651.1 hypothetical protein GJV80_19515 [Microlunatus sp. Gsoil 973]
MQLRNVVTINRSPAQVFAFLTHFENLPLWNYAITETRRVGSGLVGLGARYSQTRTIPRPATESFEVIEFDPDRSVAIRGTLGAFEALSRYQLRGSADATVLTSTMHLESSGLLRLADSLAMPRIRAAVADNLQQLKAQLEAGPATRPRPPGQAGGHRPVRP